MLPSMAEMRKERYMPDGLKNKKEELEFELAQLEYDKERIENRIIQVRKEIIK